MTEPQERVTCAGKLPRELNIVSIGYDFVNDDGSFTQISGIFNGDFALLCGPAAVDCEGGAGNLLGRRRPEEGNGLAQMLRRHDGLRRLLLAPARRCRSLLADPPAGRDVTDLPLGEP